MEKFLYRWPVFSVDNLRENLGNDNDKALYKRLRHLVTTGRVVSVLRGVYAVVPPGVDKTAFVPDPFLVLHALRPDAIFCGHSALELEGVANQVWSHLTAYSSAKPMNHRSPSSQFSALRMPSWVSDANTVTIDRRGTFLRTTGPELTLVEGFRYPRRVGGIEELVKSAEAFPRLDLAKLIAILDQFGMQKLYAAVGWFLSREPDRWKVGNETLADLKSRRTSSPKYLEHKSFGAVMDKEWNLMIPREVARQEMSVEF